MIDELRVTVLAENTARAPGLLGEHGLAFWIEADRHRILFDTGQGKVLRHNARQLNVPLDGAEMIVLSHGHFDHTGGLTDALEANDRVTVVLHPAALEKKYAKEKTPPHRDIGIPSLSATSLHRKARCLIWSRGPTKLVEGVHVTGEIPRTNDFEDTGGPFYRDPACADPDPLLDDQALFIETAAGLVVLLGCAHSGVINTLDYIAGLSGRQPLFAVLGGMHLVGAKMPRLEATVALLKQYDVKGVGTAHCTGMPAAAYLWSQLPGRCFECAAGSVFSVRNGQSEVC